MWKIIGPIGTKFKQLKLLSYFITWKAMGKLLLVCVADCLMGRCWRPSRKEKWGGIHNMWKWCGGWVESDWVCVCGGVWGEDDGTGRGAGFWDVGNWKMDCLWSGPQIRNQYYSIGPLFYSFIIFQYSMRKPGRFGNKIIERNGLQPNMDDRFSTTKDGKFGRLWWTLLTVDHASF